MVVEPVRPGQRARESGNGKTLPYDVAGEIRASQFHYIWPNWTINVFPGPANVRVLVFRPLDAERTVTYVDGYWAPGTSDELIEEITEFGNVVGAEDTALVEAVHAGLRSGAIPRAGCCSTRSTCCSTSSCSWPTRSNRPSTPERKECGG